MTKLNRVGIAVAASTFASLAFCGTAFAQEDNSFRLGAVHFDIHSTSPDISGPLTPPGANLKVGNADTLGLTYVRMFDDHFAGAFLFGIPPKVDVTGTGTLGPVGKIATVKNSSPTLLGQYYFNERNATWRPYIGAGLNFTKFLDAKATPALEATLGGPTSIHLENSTGLALQAGVTYALDKKWIIDFNVIRADVKSKQTTTTGFIDRSTTIDFNPTVFSLAVGYQF